MTAIEQLILPRKRGQMSNAYPEYLIIENGIKALPVQEFLHSCIDYMIIDIDFATVVGEVEE